MKIAVVTACFGGMDSPKNFPQQTVPCEHLSFSETNSPYPLAQFNARMKGKYFKLQTHKLIDADYVIWLDANVQIKMPDFVAKMLAAVSNHDIALARHPFRNCIYQEAKFITDSIAAGGKYLRARYGPQPVAAEAAHYMAEGHPAGNGLWWCGLFVRPINAKVNAFFDAWWDEVLRWSCLDQNAFAFLARKLSLNINTLDLGSFYNNDTCKLHPHLKLQ